MVRIISQNFSPQRSRHSSGETDSYLAERTKCALGLGISALGKKRLDLPECESSSDSFWESEHDGDLHDAALSEQGEEDENDDINGNEALKKSVQSKRKERRRERNKLSAQAYRQRRRSQNMKEQQQLMQLESENKRLQTLVETLERKTEQTKQYLRGCPVARPDFLFSMPHISETEPPQGAAASEVNLSSSHQPPSNSHSPASGSPFSPPRFEEQSHLNSPVFQSHQMRTTESLSNMNKRPRSASHPHAVNENSTPPQTTASPAISPPPRAAASTPLSPAPPQILLNVNANQAVPAALVIPTMAIPIKYSPQQNSAHNININAQSKAILMPSSVDQASPIPPTEAHNKPQQGAAATPAKAPLIMWNINANPPPGTVYSLMNLKVCNSNDNTNNINKNTNRSFDFSHSSNINNNNNNSNGNLNDTFSFNTNCAENGPSPPVPGSPVTVNLNEVKISGEALQMWTGQPLQRHYSFGTR